ncbi:MAG: histidine--tRNA ligase [Actinomycetota bacterium]|nr:histidine--tRNA ligase [Actinomycetota bacterium]
MPELRTPPGTFDVLPGDSQRWESLLTTFARVAAGAGYGLLITPTFEDLAVFSRVGASTDIVRKEMYDFEDKGGRHLALRPEVTASAARAYIQHRPTLPWKAWYAGSNFRYEKAQAGRYREFHQLGIEAFGSADPDLDVEVVALGVELFDALGITRVDVKINSLGDDVCRPGYRTLLLDYLGARRDQLCEEHRDRLEDNPLRVLDCKRPSCLAVAADAPRQIDHLCEPCNRHFARVVDGLDALGVVHRLDTALVRGLDYYTRTTFEYAGTALVSAQNALGGGGRYDGLVTALGGPPTPAVGFALGMERILLAVDAEAASADAASASSSGAGGGSAVDVYVVDFAGGTGARDLTARLRAAGLRVDRSFDGRSPRAQFKGADRSGARLALVLGPDELAAGTIGVKDLIGTDPQHTVELDAVVDEVRRLIR